MGGGGVFPLRFLVYFNEFLEPEILCNLKQVGLCAHIAAVPYDVKPHTQPERY